MRTPNRVGHSVSHARQHHLAVRHASSITVLLVQHADRALEPETLEERTDLANAIFDYIEIFYNRQRRHSGLEYRTPLEYELHCQNPSQTA
jgi:transposase InsO family protein